MERVADGMFRATKASRGRQVPSIMDLSCPVYHLQPAHAYSIDFLAVSLSGRGGLEWVVGSPTIPCLFRSTNADAS